MKIKILGFIICSISFIVSLPLLVGQPVKLQLLHTNPENKAEFNFPPTAPKSFKEIRNLNWPDGRKLFALDFGDAKSRKGKFIGPDGGRVYQYAKNYWYWDRRDGIRFSVTPNGGWNIRYQNHKIQSFGGSYKGITIWTFPDISQIRKISTDKDNPTYFYQKYSSDTIIAFRIFDDTANRLAKRKIGFFDLYYNKKIEQYIDYLSQSLQLSKYFSYVNTNFNFQNQGRIPVYYSNDLANYKRIINNKNASTGSVTDLFGIYICCSANSILEKSNTHLKKDIYALPMAVMLHETTHNLQHHRCKKIRYGNNFPNQKEPGAWFIEGQASFSVMEIMPKHRVYLIRKISHVLARVRNKPLNALTYNESALMGILMVQYIAKRWGPDVIKTYLDKTCMGESPDSILEKETGKTISEIYNAARVAFKKK